MEVIPVPVLEDNYAYLLVDSRTGDAAAIDAAQPDRVVAAAQERGLHIKPILTTHHHWYACMSGLRSKDATHHRLL
jgi:hydroxyacylglutathione hydrolase